jgi:hypothetical protein
LTARQKDWKDQTLCLADLSHENLHFPSSTRHFPFNAIGLGPDTSAPSVWSIYEPILPIVGGLKKRATLCSVADQRI